MLLRDNVARELLRYAVTGLASNGTLYAIYLLLSSYGLDPRAAMTITYAASVACTFMLNKAWTFDHHGPVSSALLRYVTLYALGYAANLCALTIAVDVMGWPHQWSMAVLIVASAIAIFLAQKYWVFPAKAPTASAG